MTASRRGGTLGPALVRLAVLATPLGLWPAGSDLLGLPKALLVLTAATGLLAWLAADVLRRRALLVPVNPVAAAMAVFAVLALARAAPAGGSFEALFESDRFNGPVLYAAYALLALTVQSRWRLAWLRDTLRWLVLTVGVVVVYALAQAAGVDPIGWDLDVVGVSSTLGNPNYLAAFLAITLPLLLAVAADDRLPWFQRASVGALLAAQLVVIALTKSDQGWAAGGLGVLVFALISARQRAPRGRRVLAGGAAAGLVVAGGLLLLGLAGRRGPLAFLGEFATLGFRSWSWRGATLAFLDHPVAGAGFGRFPAAFAQRRPPGAFSELFSPDVAHSVPLDLLVNGGLLIMLPYLAMVAAVVVAIVRLASHPSPDAPVRLVAGLAGAWVAYQAQSLVSIDVPPMPLLHWVIAAALASMAWPGVRTWPLGRARDGGRRAGWPAVAAVIVLVATGTPLLLLGAADTLAGQAEHAMNDQRPGPALAALQAATRLAPWDADYAVGRAHILLAVERRDEAMASLESSVRRFGDDPLLVAGAARVAVQLGALPEARAWYARARALEPRMAALWHEAACLAELAGSADAAALRRRAARLGRADRDAGGTWRPGGCPSAGAAQSLPS